MQEKIQVLLDEVDLKTQYRFLKKFGRNLKLNRHKPLFQFLAFLIALDVFVFFFTSSEEFQRVRGFFYFLSGLTLVFLFFYSIWIAFENIETKKRLKEEIKVLLENKQPILISFDPEKFIYETSNVRAEVKWDYFEAYLQSDSAIWLYPSTTLPGSPPFSIKGIGEKNFQELESIVRTKLKRV